MKYVPNYEDMFNRMDTAASNPSISQRDAHTFKTAAMITLIQSGIGPYFLNRVHTNCENISLAYNSDDIPDSFLCLSIMLASVSCSIKLKPRI